MATADSVQRSMAAAEAVVAPRRGSYIPQHAAAQFAATAGTFAKVTTKVDGSSNVVKRATWADQRSKSTVVDFAVKSPATNAPDANNGGRRYSYRPGDAAKRNSENRRESSNIGQWVPQDIDQPVVRRASYMPGDAARRNADRSRQASIVGQSMEPLSEQPAGRRASYMPGDAAKRIAERTQQAADAEPFFDGMYSPGAADTPNVDVRSRQSSTVDPLSPSGYTPGDAAKRNAERSRQSSTVGSVSNQAALRRSSYRPGDAAKRSVERDILERRRQSSVTGVHLSFDGTDGTYNSGDAAKRNSAERSWQASLFSRSRPSSTAEPLSPNTVSAGDEAKRRNADRSRHSSVAESPVSPGMPVFASVPWSSALPALDEDSADQNDVSEPSSPRMSDTVRINSKERKLSKRQSFLRFAFNPNANNNEAHDSVNSTHIWNKDSASQRASASGSDRRDSVALKQRKSSTKGNDRTEKSKKGNESPVELETLEGSPRARGSLGQTEVNREHARMALEGIQTFSPPKACDVPASQSPPLVSEAVKIIKKQEKDKRRQTLTSFIQGY